jgi:hypothetical protein
MTNSDSAERLIRIDSEHFVVRLLVPILAIALVVVAHLSGTSALDRLLGDGSVDPVCLMLLLDIALFLGASYGIERLLKRWMPSRRSAMLSDTALVVTDRRRRPPAVARVVWDKTVNVQAWRFPIQRGTRVPKGWYCMALRLLQDDTETVLYTFMPPEEAEASIGYRQFVRLRPRRETRSNTDLGAAAEQRRLLKLEDARWEDGAEIAREDFHALLAMLRQRTSDWM